MKYQILVASFFSTLLLADSFSEFKEKVKSTVTEFEIVETYIDYSIVPYTQRSELRENFKEAYGLLNETLNNIGPDNEKVKEGLENSFQKIRKAGLLVPFWYIRKDDRDTVIQKFLDAQDKVQQFQITWDGLVNTPEPLPIPVSNKKFWKNGKQIWKNVGKLTWEEAKKACEGLSKTLPEIKKWALPRYLDLAFAYKKMKEKTQNTLFGQEAALYTKVWTSEKIGGETDISCVEFQKEEARIASPNETLDTVCLGEE